MKNKKPLIKGEVFNLEDGTFGFRVSIWDSKGNKPIREPLSMMNIPTQDKADETMKKVMKELCDRQLSAENGRPTDSFMDAKVIDIKPKQKWNLQ